MSEEVCVTVYVADRTESGDTNAVSRLHDCTAGVCVTDLAVDDVNGDANWGTR